MNNIIKKSDESDFEYKVRLCLLKLNKEIDLDWIEIVEQLNLECSADHLRKLAYAYKEYSEYLENETINKTDEDKIIKEYELKKNEFEKEKIKFRDAKRAYNKILNEDAKFDAIKEILINEIRRFEKEKPLLNQFANNDIRSGQAKACLMLSDFHLGVEVNNSFNKYNTDVCIERINSIKDKVIKYSQLHDIDTLKIELLGDLISGAIHTTLRIYNNENVVQQVIMISEILADFISELAFYIPKIEIYNSVGNHGRVFQDKKQSIPDENFEYLIKWWLKERLKGYSNITFIENDFDKEFITYEICGVKVVSCHGHNIKLNSVIQDLSTMLRYIPDEIHLGHWHSASNNNYNNVEVIVNGSLVGTDQFAKGICKVNKPSQKFIVYTDEVGKLCEYNLI